MNEHGSQFDAIAIDRLVDGELSTEERRDLLVALDDQSDGWRRCALAFVEAQSWGASMKRIASGASEPIEQPSAAQAAVPVNVESSRSRSRRHDGAWLAIAASLLAAFGLGYQFNSPSGREPARQIAQTGEPQSPMAPRLQEPNGDAVTLVVNDRQGRPQRFEVPLVEGSRLGAGFADAPQWSSPELHRQLKQQGLGLQARRRYAPMYFEQQNGLVPMVVPVDDAMVTPVSRQVF